jgi:hypothetical protein
MSTFTGTNKSSSTWTGQNKNLGGLGYLLLETGFFLLTEASGKLILDQTSAGGVVWTGVSKS